MQLDEDNELELDEKNLDFEKDFFDKFNKLDKYDSSDEEEGNTKLNSSSVKGNGKKLVINRKQNAKKQEASLQQLTNNNNSNSNLQESVMISDKLRVSLTNRNYDATKCI